MLNSKIEKIIVEYINKYQKSTGKKDIKVLNISDGDEFLADYKEIKYEKFDIEKCVSLQDKEYDIILCFDVENTLKNKINADFLKILSQKCKIFLTNATISNNYKIYSKFFKYWSELKFYFEYYKGETPTYRPVIFASNDYSLLNNKGNIDLVNIYQNKNPYFNNDSYYINEKSIYDDAVNNNMVFRKELLIYAPYLIGCNSVKNNFNKDLDNYVISDKETEKVLLKKNEIGCMYRDYFNYLLKTSFYLDRNNKVYSKTKFINTFKQKITNGRIIIKSGIKRYLSNNKTMADVINENINDKSLVKKQFGIFIQEIFKKYKTKDDNLLLSNCLNSITLQNCLSVGDKCVFFDEKHELKEKFIDKSFVLFSAVYNSPIMDFNLKNELYLYFCLKLNLKCKAKECLEYQKYLWEWNMPNKLKMDKDNLINTVKYCSRIHFAKWLCNLICYFIPKEKKCDFLNKYSCYR